MRLATAGCRGGGEPAGGLGVLGAVAYSPEQLELELKWIDEHVDGKPYGVDTVIPPSTSAKDQGDISKEQLDRDDHARAPQVDQRPARSQRVPPLPDDVEEIESLLDGPPQRTRALRGRDEASIALIANALGPRRHHQPGARQGIVLVAAALCGP